MAGQLCVIDLPWLDNCVPSTCHVCQLLDKCVSWLPKSPKMCANAALWLGQCVLWLPIAEQMCAINMPMLPHDLANMCHGCPFLGKCVPWLPNCWENVCHRHALAAPLLTKCVPLTCPGCPLLGGCVPWLPIVKQMCSMVAILLDKCVMTQPNLHVWAHPRY